MANNINEINRIAADTKFTGDLATRTDIRIDGTFEGRLFCDARVVVGEKAIIKGDIFCTFIDFNGTMLLCEGHPVPQGRLLRSGRPLFPEIPGRTGRQVCR